MTKTKRQANIAQLSQQIIQRRDQRERLIRRLGNRVYQTTSDIGAPGVLLPKSREIIERVSRCEEDLERLEKEKQALLNE